VRFSIERETEAALSNRDVGLIILVLMNLIQNAIQATPPGREVTLRLHRSGQDLSCAVADGGAGFPEELRPVMFTPCSSTRDGGSGIGLAISKQLANHLGARLEMRSSTESGCVFVLILPNSLILGHSTVASSDLVG
jgi:signal transduction histidine kinase